MAVKGIRIPDGDTFGEASDTVMPEILIVGEVRHSCSGIIPLC